MILLDVAHETEALLALAYFHLEERAFLEFFPFRKFFQWHPENPGLIEIPEGFFRFNHKFPFGPRMKAYDLLFYFLQDLT
jgi:hypothetical protein